MQITAELKEGVEHKNCEILLGGDDSNPTWEEYISNYKPEFRPHFEAIRTCVESGPYMRGLAADICNNHFFECSDGLKIAFSWRAWGDLMQAIVGRREGYMVYYM